MGPSEKRLIRSRDVWLMYPVLYAQFGGDRLLKWKPASDNLVQGGTKKKKSGCIKSNGNFTGIYRLG